MYQRKNVENASIQCGSVLLRKKIEATVKIGIFIEKKLAIFFQ